MSQHARFSRRAAGALAAVAALVLAAACTDVKTALLSAPDPDLIDPSLVQSPDGANAVRIGALARFRTSTAGSDGIWLFGGLVTDEWSTSSTFIQNDEADQRKMALNNGTVTGFYRTLNQVRTASNQAIGLLRTYAPTPAANIAEMYFARAFAEMQIAQDFCNGVVISNGAVAVPVAGSPMTNVQVFNMAVASYDSALAIVGTATDASSTLIRNAATVGKARALIGLNQHTQAAALVAAIATSFTYDVTFSTTSGDNILWSQPNSSQRYTVGDSLEGNGRNLLVTGAQPFFSAQDPRLPVSYTVTNAGRDTLKSQDGLTFSRRTTLWARSTAVPVVNGIDARMVEAEARAKSGDIAGMMTILNALRAAPPKLGEVQATAAQLPALAAPATTAAAVDLFFREKGFWTFSRGQRLSDKRRLMRQYGRTEPTTFPTGQHYRGGPYGTDVNFPTPIDERNNPNFNACADRLP
ncbi:MAG: hypothetical protein FJ202_11075 [Gemmatimonadetes bacterium]|nr:hypothetical protein [Gemmatimonadota bacterium]